MQVLIRAFGLMVSLALVSCASVAPEPPRALAPVNLIVFPGGFNWPVWVAQEKGFFARNGIAVTAVDNLIAYREGQGEVPKIGPDLFAFMGGDNGFLRLVTIPSVRTFDDVRGKTLSVDALTTGYAFVLLEILERNGLVHGRD